MTVTPGSPRAWLLATRPATLTAALVPVLVGASVALHSGLVVRWGCVFAAALGAVWIQIGTNLANDVFDYEKGADTAERLGPTRVTQAGLLSAAQVRAGMVVSFALATAAGAYLALVAGFPVVVLGVLSIASGVAYTGGPYPLGYNGLGDVFVLAFFGFAAVCGTVFVATGAVTALSLWCALPVGALATAVLAVNNTRDHETDARAGKRTLVVRFGRRFGELEYAAALAAAYAVPLALALTRRAGFGVLATWATIPWGVRLWRALVRERGAPLNAVLAGTAKLLLAYGLLLGAALALSAR